MVFTPSGCLLLMGQDGEIISYSHRNGELQLPYKEYDFPVDSRYKQMGVVDKFIYAVGITRTILQNQKEGQWQEIGQSTHTTDMKKKDNLDMGFFSLDGFNPKDLYASGYNTDT